MLMSSWFSWIGQKGGRQDGDEESLRVPTNTLNLHVLHEPKHSEAELDVIAVHGLGGDSYSTWTNHHSECLWLRDLLPKCKGFQNARIMTFGYDAQTFARPLIQATRGRVFTFAEALLFELSNVRSTPKEEARPIIFVAHSLGGIVLKSALIRAYTEQNHYASILNSTKYLVFFGTPHQGADVAVWATYLGNLGQGLGFGSNPVTQDLKRWSTPLVELAVNFGQIASRFDIVTFFEQSETYGVMVVNEMSARMAIGNEKAIGLRANHLQICKFESADTEAARTVLRCFESIAIRVKAQEVVETEFLGLPDVSSGVRNDEALEKRLAELRN